MPYIPPIPPNVTLNFEGPYTPDTSPNIILNFGDVTYPNAANFFLFFPVIGEDQSG